MTTPTPKKPMTTGTPKNSWHIVTERPGVKTSELIAACRALFPVWCWQADEEFDKDFPAPTTATTREFKPNIEADEEHRNKSYDNLLTAGIQGITLRERLIMELQYFAETGKHLDIVNITLCSGSLYRGGYVPSGGWGPDGGRFYVNWDNRDYASGYLRCREVVRTLPASPLEPLVAAENIKKGEKVVVEGGKVRKVPPVKTCKTCGRPL